MSLSFIEISPYFKDKINFGKKWRKFYPKKEVSLEKYGGQFSIILNGEKIGEYFPRCPGEIKKVIYIKKNLFLVKHFDFKNKYFSIFTTEKILLFTDYHKILFFDKNCVLFLCQQYLVENDIYHYNYNKDGIISEEKYPDDYIFYGPFKKTNDKIFILEDVLKKLILNPDLKYLQTFKKPKKSVFKCKVVLNGKKEYIETSFIKKINSDFLYFQLENGNTINLPISKLDTSFECLDYLGSKYLSIKILKKYIKDNSISQK